MDGLALTPGSVDYDVDFHAWALDQARRLREIDVPGLDTCNLAEEIESLGRSDRRELASRLGVLLTHLLKWQFQPDRQGESWVATIGEQRRAIDVLLRESPSLRPTVPDTVAGAYRFATRQAARETGLSRTGFPQPCPWLPGQVLDEDWLPDGIPPRG